MAHGFFTLSLLTDLLDDILTVDEVSMILNYGLNGCASRRRLRSARASACTYPWPRRPIPRMGKAVYHLEYEIEGKPKPPCVADQYSGIIADDPT